MPLSRKVAGRFRMSGIRKADRFSALILRNYGFTLNRDHKEMKAGPCTRRLPQTAPATACSSTSRVPLDRGTWFIKSHKKGKTPLPHATAPPRNSRERWQATDSGTRPKRAGVEHSAGPKLHGNPHMKCIVLTILLVSQVLAPSPRSHLVRG